MNHLVFLDARAGELEKILSGVKTMLVKEADLAPGAEQPIQPGDCLYFLRGEDDHTVRVKATVIGARLVINPGEGGLSQILKEMQARLQFTEQQYNYWSAKEQLVLIEFEKAQKISAVPVTYTEGEGRTGWIRF